MAYMAKKKTRAKKKTNHLASEESFRFALNVAVLATLMAVLLYMVGEVRTGNQDVRTKAAPSVQYK
jgi:hypothetical protein